MVKGPKASAGSGRPLLQLLLSAAPCLYLHLLFFYEAMRTLLLLVGHFSGSASLPVWIRSCLLPSPPVLYRHWLLPPAWLTGAALCCPTFLLCGSAFWLVRAAVSCAWSNHVAPPIVTSHGSVKRQGPPSTLPPACPSQSHALEHKIGGFLFLFALTCEGDVLSATITSLRKNAYAHTR